MKLISHTQQPINKVVEEIEMEYTKGRIARVTKITCIEDDLTGMDDSMEIDNEADFTPAEQKEIINFVEDNY